MAKLHRDRFFNVWDTLTITKFFLLTLELGMVTSIWWKVFSLFSSWLYCWFIETRKFLVSCSRRSHVYRGSCATFFIGFLLLYYCCSYYCLCCWVQFAASRAHVHLIDVEWPHAGLNRLIAHLIPALSIAVHLHISLLSSLSQQSLSENLRMAFSIV